MSKNSFTLTLEQKNELQQCKERNCDEAVAKRAAVVLAYAEDGATLRSVAAEFSMRPNQVGMWKNRYLESGLKGLMNLPRGSTRDVYGPEFEEELLQKYRSTPPEGVSHWTTGLLAEQLDVSPNVVGRYLRKAGIYLSEPGRGRKNAGSTSPESSTSNSNEAGSSSAKASEGKLNIEVVIRLVDDNGNVVATSSAVAQDAVSDKDHRDFGTREGLLKEINSFENSAIATMKAASSEINEKCFSDTKKKEK